MSFAYVLEGASPLAPDEIVDPGSICEVEFSISVRRRADIEFFNRIGRLQPFATVCPDPLRLTYLLLMRHSDDAFDPESAYAEPLAGF